MFPFSLTSFVKFLIGILLVQLATVLLVYTAMRTNLAQTWFLFAALGVSLGAVTALWFNSVADSTRKQALARAQVGFSREREKIRVRAEKEKTKEVKSTQRQIHREKQKARSGSNLKNGVMIGGAVVVGAGMLLTQMVTLGLLTIASAGGAAVGYGVRARQERLAQGGRGLLGRREGVDVKVIGDDSNARLIKGPGDEGKAKKGH